MLNFSKNIPSDLKNIPELSSSLLKELAGLPLNKSQLHDIKLSLEEALVNAIKHGNKFDPELFVDVKVTADADSLVIAVSDQGKGFDIKNVPDPTKHDNLQKLSGRGVALIKSHMDEVEYLNGGSKVVMKKFLNRG